MASPIVCRTLASSHTIVRLPLSQLTPARLTGLAARYPADQRVPTGLAVSRLSASHVAFSTSTSARWTATLYVMSPKRITPDEVLNRNQAWSQETLKIDRELFTANAAGQSPPILWIGCSDSRVPESVVSHVKPGDMFVHRNIANQFSEQDDSANSVLTYGVEALGVEHIIIVGHTSCGGILASLSGAQGEQLPPSESLQRYLKPLVNLCKSVRDSMGLSAGQEPSDSAAKDELLIRATEANVREQVRKVIESKVVQANWSGKRVAFPGKPSAKVKVHGWIHDISNGKLRDLGVTMTPPSED